MSATDVKFATLEGLAFGKVRFSGFIPHGAGRREVRMTVAGDDILRLADALRGCPNNYEEPRTGLKPRTLEEARQSKFVLSWCGHAVWHLQHPDRPMPCRPDSDSLEVLKLDCRKCGATPGKACRTGDAVVVDDKIGPYHPARWLAFRDASKCDPDASQGETNITT